MEMEFLAHGENLVRLSYHPTKCAMCAPWNGVIVALMEPTKDYPYTLQDAYESGWGHPNCLHGFTLYVEGFSDPGPSEPSMTTEDKDEPYKPPKPGDGRMRARKGVKNPFGLQFFAFNSKEERQKIRSGYYNLKVSPQKQARHIEGTMEYERYCKALSKQGGKYRRKPSILYGNPKRAQEILDKYAGTGIITKGRQEYIQLPEVAGLVWHSTKDIYVETKWVSILYSRKSGSHLYPVFPPSRARRREEEDA